MFGDFSNPHVRWLNCSVTELAAIQTLNFIITQFLPWVIESPRVSPVILMERPSLLDFFFTSNPNRNRVLRRCPIMWWFLKISLSFFTFPSVRNLIRTEYLSVINSLIGTRFVTSIVMSLRMVFFYHPIQKYTSDVFSCVTAGIEAFVSAR